MGIYQYMYILRKRERIAKVYTLKYWELLLLLWGKKWKWYYDGGKGST